MLINFFFFFSSRRRHTRSDRDWSSDVCSSDLLPGINGFADGVAYTVSKYGVIYAIDLTTGAQIWSYNYVQALGVKNADISTPAVDGTNLVIGYNQGILDVNAVTGALIWTSTDPASIKAISSPAIA